MKEIIGREKIAEVLNFGKYPVLKIDMDKEAFMDVLYEGDKVRVDFGTFHDGSRWLQQGYVLYNTKDERITISAETTMLVKDLTFNDCLEMAEYGSSQILNDNQDVIVVIHSKKNNEFKVYLAKTDRGDKFCSTIMYIE